MYNLNTPIWQLTVGEFLELAEKNQVKVAKETTTDSFPKKNLIYGIKGLAKLLECSTTTAQKIKNSGVIDKAISQFGRKLIIDADLVLKLMTEKRRK